MTLSVQEYNSDKHISSTLMPGQSVIAEALITSSQYHLSVPALLPHHFLCSPALLFPLLLPFQPIMLVWQALLAAVVVITIDPISALKGQRYS